MSSAPPRQSQSPAIGCPSVDDLSRFIERTASPDTREQILAHLDTCETCRLLLAATLRESECEQHSGAACSPRTFPVGEVVGGRYRIVRLIARGGMGEVYEAHDQQLSELVALKTIACTGLDNATLYVRIRKEVQLARKVTHANVCRILEFGLHQQVYREQQETIPFFTMELLDGETLAEYIRRRGSLSVAELRPIAIQIAQGLSAIHEAGIVHRDLKPENIFLLNSKAGELRVIVMDFGLARNQDSRGSVQESSSSSTVGTPSYMAPEQSLGSTPTVAWDIFAFGVIIFRAMTGVLPFKGNTPVALAMARLREPAPRLSSLVPEVDPALEHIVARCLQRDPAHRFASAAEIQWALMDLRARPTVTRTSAGLIALVLAVSAVAGAVGWWAFEAPTNYDVNGATAGQPLNPAISPAHTAASPQSTAPALSGGAASLQPPDSIGNVHRQAVSSANLDSKQEPGHPSSWRVLRRAAAGNHRTPVPNRTAGSTAVSRPVVPVFGEDDIAIPTFAGSRSVRSDGEK